MESDHESTERDPVRSGMLRGSTGWDEFVAARSRAFESLRQESEIFRLEKAWTLSTAGSDLGAKRAGPTRQGGGLVALGGAMSQAARAVVNRCWRAAPTRGALRDRARRRRATPRSCRRSCRWSSRSGS
jgi:hypothetical protein